MQNLEQPTLCQDVPISTLCDVKLWHHFSVLTVMYMPFGFLLLLSRLVLIGAYGLVFPLFPHEKENRYTEYLFVYWGFASTVICHRKL